MYSCSSKKTDVSVVPVETDICTSVSSPISSEIPTNSPTPSAEPLSEPENSDFLYQMYGDSDLINITGYIGNETEIVIPETINGMKVRQINGYVFAQCDNADKIVRIIVSGSECEIDDKAFAECINLKELTVAGERTTAFSRMFDSIPESLSTFCYMGNTLPKGAFAGFTSLKNVILSDSLETVTEEAFAGCGSLETVSAGGVRIIEMNAFKNCSSLKFDISELGPVEEIRSKAFSNCNMLEIITLPITLKRIDTNAFSGCNGVRTINYNAEDAEFNGYYSPFSGMDGVETLIIGNAVRIIPSLLFNGCNFNLSELTIPGNVETVGDNSFCKVGTVKEITISEGVRIIGDNAFSSIAQLEKVSLPGALTEIGSGIFRWCTDLKTVVLGDGITVIGSRMFGDCSGLTEITIPGSVRTVGERAFEYCTSLEKVNFTCGETSVKKLAVSDRAFYICLSLDSAIASLDFASVGEAAFFAVGKGL